MKRVILNFCVGVLYTSALFAAGNTSISRTIPTKTTNDTANINNTTDTSVSSRTARRVTSQNTSSNSESTNKKTSVSRNVSRIVPNTVSKESENNTSTARVAQRAGNSHNATLEDGVNTIGRNARVSSASINNTAAVKRAGVVLRPSTAEVGGRAIISGTNTQTGSNIDEQVKSVHSRSSNTSKQQIIPTAESIANAKDILEKTADLNKTCQEQYNECMDQFCAVIDTNQKRCSCSANLSKYAKVQEAVESANAKLNEVAQNIRYIGLSADEITAIMSETEAEEELSKTKDTSETRSLLDEIAEMIEDPSTASSSLSSSSSSYSVDSLLDMDFDFSSDSTDMFNLDILNTSSSTDISSKRGKELYNEATKRCKTVLNQCKEAGGTENQITGNYDLAIDKDCIAYEQGLEKLNQTLESNVRSANLMLQKARLAVLENKNQYDAKSCVGALETCMLDDMVCGEGYLKCLDPTKKYIDENGSVVLGQQISAVTATMSDYNNAEINSDSVKAAVTSSATGYQSIVKYLMTKIGTGATVKDGGLCRAVLDKCQTYTYTDNGRSSNYNPYNDIVVAYIQRALVNIKAAQHKIISDYASTCLEDVEDCYNQQITQINSWSTVANTDNIFKVMKGACYNIALTCGYAVLANDSDYKSSSAEDYIIGISEIFYQSLLCPDNSIYNYVKNRTSADENRTIGGYVNARCKCNDDYAVFNGYCVAKCLTTQYRSSSGYCTSCDTGETATGGDSTKENNSCETNTTSGSTTTTSTTTTSTTTE